MLEDTHPEIDREFKKGNFVAQRHVHHGFSQAACDQVIEQTVNRDSKIKGGITMYTQNRVQFIDLCYLHLKGLPSQENAT